MINESATERTQAPEFTPAELQAMHRWCLRYRDLVRCGRTPTGEQDQQFLLFSFVTYAEGVANGR